MLKRFFFSSRASGWWAFSLIFILMLWGNLVAGFEAGLGCPDWPLCHGRVVPPYSVETYLEFIHRLIGLFAGIFVFLLIYYRFREYQGKYKLFPLAILLIFCIQVVIGGVVVLLKLPPSLIVFHFGLALVVFLGVLYMAVFAPPKREPQFLFRGKSLWYFLFLLVVSFQMILGAILRHYRAGLACGREFPLCLGSFIPEDMSFATFMHVLHRLTAYFILLVALFFPWFSSGKERKIWLLYVFLLLLQITIAVGVIHTQLNPWMVFLHMLLGLSLLVGSFHMYTYSMRQN